MSDRTGARATRLIALIMMLKSRGYTVDELAEHFGTDKRTIYRDLKRLREDLLCPLEPRNKRYQIDSGFYMPALALTEAELVALFLACQTLEKRGTMPDEARNALAKLRASAQTRPKQNLAKVEDAIEIAPARGAFYRPEVLREALRANNEEKVLEMLYHSRERAEPVWRRFEPWVFFYWQEMWYMYGHDQLTGEARRFRLDRVRELKVTADSYVRNREQGPGSATFHRFDVGDGKAVRVVLRVTPDIARYLSELPAHETQKIKGLEVEYSVKAPLRMAQWLLGLGPLEVLEPKELRAEVVRLAGEMVRLHGG